MRRRWTAAVLAALCAAPSIAPRAAVATGTNPAPWCVAPAGSAQPPAVPDAVANTYEYRFLPASFGCFQRLSGGQYVFANGRIAAVPAYGTYATFAMVIVPNDPDRIVHLYLMNSNQSFDTWIVRLTFDGDLINQVTYPARRPSVAGEQIVAGNTYVENMLVHPGAGRHGTFEIGLEGCTKNALQHSSCVGFGSASFTVQM